MSFMPNPSESMLNSLTDNGVIEYASDMLLGITLGPIVGELGEGAAGVVLGSLPMIGVVSRLNAGGYEQKSTWDKLNDGITIDNVVTDAIDKIF